MIPKTIMFLETGTQGGGSFVSLYQYLQVFDRNRIRPVVCFVNRTHFVEKIEALGIPVHLLRDPLYTRRWIPVHLCLRVFQRGIERVHPTSRPLFDRAVHHNTARQLTGLMIRERVDLLVLNVQIDRDGFALCAAQKLKIPVVSHLRSRRGGGFTTAAARNANQNVTAFIANSAAAASYWKSKGLDPGKMEVVHNAAPSQQTVKADLETELKIPRDARSVCCVGRLAGIKGQDVLIKAVAELSTEFPALHLLLIGDGKEQNRLEKLARECRLHHRVVFAGWRQDAMVLASSATILAVPSREEAFGRVVIEGMLAGIPVVASRAGGIPEILTDEVDGLLVDTGDHKALAVALRRLLNDPTLAKRLSDEARHTAESRFSLLSYVRRIEKIYCRALENRP